MFLTNQALLDDLEHAVEQRFGEMLAPGPGMAQGLGQLQVELLDAKLAVGQQTAGEVVLAQLAAHFGIEGGGERSIVFLRQRQAGSHGMPAEFADQPRMLGCHRIQRIADMQARHRTRRTFEQAIAGIGKGNRRPVVTLLQARGEDADHPLVPIRFEQAQAERHVRQRQVLELGQGFALHALFDGLAILVQLVELLGHVAGQSLVLAQQAFDAQAHVVQTPGRIQPWPEDKTEVGGGNPPVLAPRHFQHRTQARTSAAGTDARQALMHQDAVVGV